MFSGFLSKALAVVHIWSQWLGGGKEGWREDNCLTAPTISKIKPDSASGRWLKQWDFFFLVYSAVIFDRFNKKRPSASTRSHATTRLTLDGFFF